MARHLSGREHAGLQHGVLANPSPGGKTGGAGRRARACRSVGSLGTVSCLAVALRFLRTPLPAARPADGGIRFSAEFPVLAGAGPVPPALLRHGGTNHVQRKRFHSSSAFFHLPGFGTHAPALDTPSVRSHGLLFPPRGPRRATPGGLPVVPSVERRPPSPGCPAPSLLFGLRSAGSVLPSLLWDGKRAILPHGHAAFLYASGGFPAYGDLIPAVRPVLLAGFPEESPLYLYAGNRPDSAFFLRKRRRQ